MKFERAFRPWPTFCTLAAQLCDLLYYLDHEIGSAGQGNGDLNEIAEETKTLSTIQRRATARRHSTDCSKKSRVIRSPCRRESSPLRAA